MMNIQEIIANKRDNKILTKQEIEYFISGYTKGDITDYQAAALIMAMYINGLNEEETKDLAISMAYSGDVLDLSEISGNIVDKHSTGGVGDKITIILMPIIASLGIPVMKMSGRGLGITGGTKDKWESIPGYKTEIALQEVLKIVKEIGISLIGQTGDLAPADKRIYALRDSISCTASMPLIAASIMSKKIAGGANKIVLDVTCGSGAFMKTEEEAIELAKTMKDIGRLANKETVCILTAMDEPIGRSVGNSLEIIEAVEALKGDMEEDIKEIVLTVGSYIIKLAGKNNNIEENREMILKNIQNGKAYEKFLELVENQGGDISYIKDTSKFEKAKYILPVVSETDGYIEKMDSKVIGEMSVHLGAGRLKKEDEIDHLVGFIIEKKVGNKVQKGDIIAFIHANDEEKGKTCVCDFKNAYTIVKNEVQSPKYILGIIE